MSWHVTIPFGRGRKQLLRDCRRHPIPALLHPKASARDGADGSVWSCRGGSPRPLLPALPKPLTSSGQACPKPSSVLFTQPPASSQPNVLNVLLKGGDLGNRERYRAGKGSVGLGSRFPSSTGEKQMKPSPHTLLKRKLSTRKLYIPFKRQAMCWKYSHSRPSRGS